MKQYFKKHKYVQHIAWVILIIAAWEVSSQLGLVNKYLLPSFSSVISELIAGIGDGKFLYQILNSLEMIAIGFSTSLVIATLVVVLCIYSKVFASFFRTLCVIFNPLPGVAIMPIIIMLFGIGNGAMVILMIHSVIWPLAINLLSGINTIPAIHTEYAKNIELSKLRMVTEVYFFLIMPFIISGLRIGWSRSWRALISAEMVFGLIGNLGGLGYYIYTNRAYGDMTKVMEGIIVIIAIGIFVESLVFRYLEKKTVVRWGMKNE